MAPSSKLCLLLCLPLAGVACGPVAATSVLDDARLALSRAHSAGGDQLAPYETTLADLYLAKAQEEQGHDHDAEAGQLGETALKFAGIAARKAAARRPSAAPAQSAEIPRPPPPPPRIVPVPLPDPKP